MFTGVRFEANKSNALFIRRYWMNAWDEHILQGKEAITTLAKFQAII